MLELLGAIGSIVLIDLVLSGDNALVIGAAAAKLPQPERWRAIFVGGIGAIVLRIAFAFIATLLLQLPLLQAIGGCILFIIAVRLLTDRENKPHERTDTQACSLTWSPPALSSSSFMATLFTILIADVTMSLDNVLAVGALAHGNLIVLAVGVLLSLIVLLFASAIVAKFIDRLPWLLDIAALVLAWTGATMILNDRSLGPILVYYPWTQIAFPAIALASILAVDLLLRLRESRHIHIKGESQ